MFAMSPLSNLRPCVAFMYSSFGTRPSTSPRSGMPHGTRVATAECPRHSEGSLTVPTKLRHQTDSDHKLARRPARECRHCLDRQLQSRPVSLLLPAPFPPIPEAAHRA